MDIRVFILCDEDGSWREEHYLNTPDFTPEEIPTHDIAYLFEGTPITPEHPDYKAELDGLEEDDQ